MPNERAAEVQNQPALVIAGIGTDVGKTVASAVVAATLEANYWKPISCGSDDREMAERLLEGERSHCLPTSYIFSNPVSPHEAAELEGRAIDLDAIVMPQGEGATVIEMAGGVLVPLGGRHLAVDLFTRFSNQWVVVARNYLGSINHTLLTIEALKARGVDIIGIIMNGPANSSSEAAVASIGGIQVIGRIEQEPVLTAQVIRSYSERWRQKEPWKTLRG